jgi:type I restriction enzyme M protein
VEVAAVDRTTLDLGVKNPNQAEAAALRDPRDILAEIAALDAESAAILERIGELV